MHGVVSLLDGEHYERVETLWAEIERGFGVRGVYATPFPHFSYHVAEEYDLDRLLPLLQRIATDSRPFSVGTTGIGIFTGPRPVVYVPVVRDPRLSRFHESLWPPIEAASRDAVAYYSPDRWLPHITVSFGDVDQEKLPAIIRFLNEQDLTWLIRVDNIALITDTDGRQDLEFRFEFGVED